MLLPEARGLELLTPVAHAPGRPAARNTPERC